MTNYSNEDIELFKELVNKYRYDFCKLVYIIFPFGQKGHELEHMRPYAWQMEQWKKMSEHLGNPLTRDETYRLIISSGNGAAKTAFGAMTFLMLMYTQRVRGRITANTQPQLNSVVWPEYDIWFRHARFVDVFFEKFGTSIKARDPLKSESWRLDAVTWNEQSPASISGLHNKGACVLYIFEEAPGIPAVIWDYTRGAFTETDTIKIFMAFGNSDDPESKFEQNMSSPLWNAVRIDTRTLTHIKKKSWEDILLECGGDEDHDEFRVRVRGLPRKQAKDSIIMQQNVVAALERAEKFDIATVNLLPCTLMCDPAWQGGDETVIWYQHGNYARLLERYRLDKAAGEDHMLTYNKLVSYEMDLRADRVLIDQGEGTAIKTLANNNGKMTWELISFAGEANDAPEFKDRQYHNIRAQMYYEADKWLREGGVLDARIPEWKEDIKKQLCWTKGTRHKISQKKLAEPKADIKARVGQSPDIADGFVLAFARPILERLPENDRYADPYNRTIGSEAFKVQEYQPNYDDVYDELYD